MGLRHLRKQGALLALVVAVAAGGHASAAEDPYDLLIRGGTVIDGTGAPVRRADVAVRGARIVAIGRIDETSARETIDATGLIVAPGFIDAHNHVDASSLYVRERAKSTGPILNEGFLTQGVTTMVGGPDGGLIRQSRAPIWLTLCAIEEQEVRQLMQQPWNMIASDGSYVGTDGEVAQHPRSTGTFTRVLGHYVREQHVLTLPAAIRKMTSMPADFLGLHDRGRIAFQRAAHITIFDERKVRDTSTWAHPQSLSQGIVHVIVNGRVVLKGGMLTGAAPGRILKRQRPPSR